MRTLSLKIENYWRTRLDKSICFRNKSLSYLSKRLLDPLASEDEIRYISDDLLGEPFKRVHHCLIRKKPWSLSLYFSQWTDPWLVRKDIAQLLRDDFNLPTYFLDKVLLAIQEGMKEEDYWKERWIKVYQLAMLQNKVSSKALLNQILYFAKTLKNDETWTRSGSLEFTRIELLSIGINHKNFPPEDLTRLCGHSDSLVRNIASRNPSCPIEGKVALSLMGGAEN